MFTSIRVGGSRSGSAVDVVFIAAGAAGLPRGLKVKDRTALDSARKSASFKGAVGETMAAGPNGLLVGIGDGDAVDSNALRQVGAAVVRYFDRHPAKSVALHASAIAAKQIAPEAAGAALGEGFGLANWRFREFEGAATKQKDLNPALALTTTDAAMKRGLKSGLEMADAVNEARRIAAMPPNICNPPWMAKEVRRLARAAGLTCRVITYAQAQKMGMGGIVNVGRGSAAKPCLIVLEHKPAKIKKGVRLALVGKTMTYDSGGYSLKLSGGMKGMKYDGNGGCAVLGAMLAVAKRKLPVHVVALLPCAENMVSDDAYRPDDIITMYNGTTVEVTNTDAEGRLILADALAYACKDIKPTAIVDMATLTGGVVVALGSWCAGLWANDDDHCQRVEAAATSASERVWRLPVWDEHRDFMRSRHADLWNSGPKRDGHPIQGAAFLSFFVDEGMPWAHIDIAGTSASDSNTPLTIAGPTGFGVRLLTEYVASHV